MTKKSILLQCLFMSLLNYISGEITNVLCASNALIIDLPQGKVKGSYDLFNKQIKFLGIPYASVTKRFEEPGSPPSWNGTLIADRGNVRCNQYLTALNKPVGQEDCLVLNIFTPTCPGPNPFPVMVFIHGGGYKTGSNNDGIYNPKYIVNKNCIVVTMNYRLGAFGFLCLGLPGASGNVGLKDQLAALKWIQNNIHYFGGDRNSVTLFGASAGAASVHHFLLSQSARGLFHRAIMQGGSILMPQAFSYNPVETASKVALGLGYNTSDPNELLNIFKNSTADDIVKASNADQKNNVFASYLFLPCVETAVMNKMPLITKQPSELVKSFGLNISVIAGSNNREGIYWAQYYDPQQTREELKNRFVNIIPSNFHFKNDGDKTAFIDDAMEFYFANRTVINDLIDYLSDSVIIYPLLVSTKGLLKNPNRTVHNYYFKYDSLRNLNKFLTRLPTTPGACHGDELLYLFNPAVYSAIPSIPSDVNMILLMTKLWTNFAKTGKPSTSETVWTPSSGEELNFLSIDRETKMITLPNEDRMKFWRRTYEKYGR